MKAEYCPAVVNYMTPDKPECNANLKICGYNDRKDRSERNEVNFLGCQSLYREQKKGIVKAGLKKNQEDFLILPYEKNFNTEIYTDLKILPNNELLMMKVYCKSAGEDGFDVSDLLSFLDIAGKKYEEGDTDGFYAAAESFYTLYDELSKGRGGRLYVSGDYLSFLYEPVQVSFSNPYL